VIAGIKGGVCQSCAMPMYDTGKFGTDFHGRTTEDYCVQCYQKGEFTDPDMDMFDMIDKSVAWIMNAGVYPEAHIRETLSEIIPRLKRWNIPVTTHYFN